ncbi:MAG: hypothetical protein SP1CHLAM54_07270 [Chlamydiia bacterium]|nr:hypothetical protein [Chlamydiia bacterium]MCH9615633.1 hypothetical protein [Chlamydiia bacterium]MCH9628964.1 hypothetical protein [Chlamydiia bacterium]
MKIVTLGPEGTYSHQAARRLFPKAKYLFVDTIEEIFEVVKDGKAEKALLPLENSGSGFVENSMQGLMRHSLSIVGEAVEAVHHYLVGFGVLEEAETLFVHPHTYSQCHQTIKKLLPKVNVVYTPSNGRSAEKLARTKSQKAVAICSRFAAKLYDIPVLLENVQDKPNNETRFVVLSKKSTKGEKGAAFLFTEQSTQTLKDLLEALDLIALRKVPLPEVDCSTYLIEYRGDRLALNDHQTKLLGEW